MHQGSPLALLLVAHVYSRNSSIIVWILPRSDYWVVSPCRWQASWDCPGRSCLLAGRLVAGRTFLVPVRVSVLYQHWATSAHGGRADFRGISGCTQSVLLQMQRSILRGSRRALQPSYRF